MLITTYYLTYFLIIINQIASFAPLFPFALSALSAAFALSTLAPTPASASAPFTLAPAPALAPFAIAVAHVSFELGCFKKASC